jgi:hypothetical protein
MGKMDKDQTEFSFRTEMQFVEKSKMASLFIHRNMQKNKVNLLFFYSLIFLAILAAMMLLKFNSPAQKLQEKIETYASILKDGEGKNIAQKGIKKICIQGPYMRRGDFENITKEKIFDYKEINEDGRFVLHITTTNDASQQILLSREISLDYKNDPSICVEKNYVHIRRDGNFVLLKLEK